MNTLKQITGHTGQVIVVTLISCLALSGLAQTQSPQAAPLALKSVKMPDSIPSNSSISSQNFERIKSQIKELAEKRNSLLGELANQNKQAEKGTNSSGGGNDKEADFTSTARMIYQQLNTNAPLASETLGINISDFAKVMDQTAVHCATGDILQVMRDFKKSAYYLSTSGSIYLDCENYYESKISGELGLKTVFHEYMRAANLEGDEYKVSSKLIIAFVKLGLPDLDGIDVAIHECHARFKNASYPGTSAAFHSVFTAELGNLALNCLIENGLTQKANPNMSTSEIRTTLGYKMVGLDLRGFANLVNGLVKR